MRNDSVRRTSEKEAQDHLDISVRSVDVPQDSRRGEIEASLELGAEVPKSWWWQWYAAAILDVRRSTPFHVL